MKIRTSFVCNSSSSSFVIVGFELNKENKNKLMKKLNLNEENFEDTVSEYYEKENVFNKLNLMYFDEEECGQDVIGRRLFRDSDEYFIESFNIKKLNEIVKEMSEKTDINEEEFEIIAGSIYN